MLDKLRRKAKKLYKDNVDYVIKMFKALPDITDSNIEELTREYLNMKISLLFFGYYKK